MCEELVGAVQRKCFISVFDRDSREIPIRRRDGGEDADGKISLRLERKRRRRWLSPTPYIMGNNLPFFLPVVPCSLETPVSATTTPCITRLSPFYSLTPGINNDLSRSIDVDVYRERY